MRQLKRRPNESEQAHTTRMTFCQLPPGQRSIANTWRAVKSLPQNEAIRVPGHFNKWSKEHRWKEYAAVWDAADLGRTADLQDAQLTAGRQAIVKRNAQLTAARTQTAEQLQALIDQEIERLKDSRRRWHLWLWRLWPGSAKRRTADLANLAAALKDAAAARLAALQDTDPRA